MKAKLKKLWANTKDDFIYGLKFAICVSMMTLGFWISYAFIWFSLGHPATDTMLYSLFGFALASECLYISWVKN